MSRLIGVVLLLAALIGFAIVSQSSGAEPPALPYQLTVPRLAADGEPDWWTPTPSPTATPAPGYSCATRGGEWGPFLDDYDWPWSEACAVLVCESEGLADAVSGAGAVGLFQLHPYDARMFDPVTNVNAAYWKWRDGVARGNPWMHWNRHGSCG